MISSLPHHISFFLLLLLSYYFFAIIHKFQMAPKHIRTWPSESLSFKSSYLSSANQENNYNTLFQYYFIIKPRYVDESFSKKEKYEFLNFFDQVGLFTFICNKMEHMFPNLVKHLYSNLFHQNGVISIKFCITPISLSLSLSFEEFGEISSLPSEGTRYSFDSSVDLGKFLTFILLPNIFWSILRKVLNLLSHSDLWLWLIILFIMW